jgi:malonyl-CoA/methylmalonyl-CoA synthetase
MPGQTNLYELFCSRFPNNPEAPFLETPGRPTLHYGELDDHCAQVHGALVRLGVQPGDRVIVQVEKSPESALLYLGCLRAGAIYIPLNTGYTEAEVEYFIRDAEPQLVVCDPQAETRLRHLAARLGTAQVRGLGANSSGSFWKDKPASAPPEKIVERTDNDIAAILYTSGTTGRSKGAMLTHRNLVSNALVLHKHWHWCAEDVLLHALPIYHAHGLFIGLHCALLNGSACLFLPRFDAEHVVALLPRATVMMGVPTFYTRLLDTPTFTAKACGHMRLFLSGSAPLLAETHRRFETRTGHRILERYGMTETGIITSNPYDGERIAGTVGFPLSGVTARVVDNDGREVAREKSGVLEIRGPNVFRGYWRNPEKSAESFRPDGYFITGDIATMDGQGRVALVGRAKDLII